MEEILQDKNANKSVNVSQPVVASGSNSRLRTLRAAWSLLPLPPKEDNIEDHLEDGTNKANMTGVELTCSIHTCTLGAGLGVQSGRLAV